MATTIRAECAECNDSFAQDTSRFMVMIDPSKDGLSETYRLTGICDVGHLINKVLTTRVAEMVMTVGVHVEYVLPDEASAAFYSFSEQLASLSTEEIYRAFGEES